MFNIKPYEHGKRGLHSTELCLYFFDQCPTAPLHYKDIEEEEVQGVGLGLGVSPVL